MTESHGMLIYHNDILPESLVDMPGDVKIKEEPSSKNPNTSLFTIEKEDHTIANFIRMKMHQSPFVKICGYRVPHPTQHRVELRVQTASDGSDREVPTPLKAIVDGIEGCLQDLSEFEKRFAFALEEKGIRYEKR